MDNKDEKRAQMEKMMKLCAAPKCRYHPNGKVEDNYHTGNVVCMECGLVLDRIIDERPEWRTKERSSAIGNQYYGDGLFTYLRAPKRKGGDRYPDMKIPKIWKEVSPQDKKLQIAYDEINAIASRMHIPRSFTDYALKLYKDFIVKASGLGARSIESLAAALLFVACRHKKCPRTLKEFEPATMASFREIQSTYHQIAPLLGEESDNAAHYVQRFCVLLNLNLDIRRRAFEIVNIANEEGLLDGRWPTTLTGGAIYKAAREHGQKLDWTRIADVAGCTKRTIMECYKQLEKYRSLLHKKKTNVESSEGQNGLV